MADNEEDSSNKINSALIESVPVCVNESVANVSVTGSPDKEEGNHNGSDGVTMTDGTDPCLAHIADAKELVGSSEVIGQILAGEVVTSFVQATEQTEGSVNAECATVSGELLTALGPATTIIYVQPDGSFVESSGLSAEEQQQLLEQLSKQQLVQVTGNEPIRLVEQIQQIKPAQPLKPAAISTIDVQQVIDHVNKSQIRSQSTTPKIIQRTVTQQPTSYITLDAGQLTAALQPQPFTIVQNASQQLQSVAKHVALQQSQNGTQSIQQKQAEPIQLQVRAPKQDLKQLQTAPITILQSQNLQTNQSLVKVPTVGTVSTPQIIHITPVPGQQQYFLQNPGEPPIQLLLQKPASVMSSISVPIVHKVQTPVASSSSNITAAKSSATKPAKVSVHPTLVLTPSSSVSSSTTKVLTLPTKTTTVVNKTVNPSARKEKPAVKDRQKKPLKIQTRSGRVSRPPKHKVKDYKFIKNEDLAESHQSDSDDYSEISVEEEEGSQCKTKEEVDGLSFRNKAFKCEECEKSYIGLAGLNRHFKLHPSHYKSHTLNPVLKEDSKPTEPETSSDQPDQSSPVKEETTQKVQADSTRQIERRRPGRPKGSGRSNLPKRLGRKPKRGRRGRPPKFQMALTVEQQERRRRTRLTEFIEQYDDEDLMEIVLPRLAKAMTVWEFVLMKVENGVSSKQQFPSIYHEFEQLHSQVKKMAEEHFNIAPASRPAITITNMEVLKSLGITDPSGALALNSQEQQTTTKTNQAPKSLRSIENAKMLPPAKRFKMENCYGDNSKSVVNQNGIQKHDANDGSVLLWEPQVVLTRLEDCTGNNGEDEMRTEELTAEMRTEEEPTAEIRTEEEPTAEKRTEEESTPEIRTEEESIDTVDNVLLEAAKPPKLLNSSQSMDITYQVKELGQVLSPDTKFDESALKDETCDPSQSVSLCQEVTIEESVASQDLITEVTELQEDHQVYIETAEGLVRQSAKELASKGIVIVNGPDGSTVHIEAPEGVPLETVHALLGIETGRNT